MTYPKNISVTQTPHTASHLRSFVVVLLSCCLVLPPTLVSVPSASAQEQGQTAVSSNGVSISFQNDGGNATSSNGVSVSFQNAQEGSAANSNGVSVAFEGYCQGAPIIIAQPQSTTVVGGRSNIFSVTVDPTATSYQWFKGASGDTSQPFTAENPLPSSTFAKTITLPVTPSAVIARDNYWVRLKNNCGTADSSTATLVAIDKLPLIFLPGIAGSRLDLNNAERSRIWTPASASGFANPFSTTGHPKLSLDPRQPGASIVVPDVIRRYEQAEKPEEKIVYDEFLRTLTNSAQGGYREYVVDENPERRTFGGCDLNQQSNNPTLYVFAYDWRKSNVEAAATLKEYIRCVQRFYPNTNIDIVAHSQGGLVARRYVLNNSNDHHIRKFITVGSPWLGAPKAINVLETGKFLDQSSIIKDPIKNSIFKSLSEFHPAVHQLVPSDAYFKLAGNVSPYNYDGRDLNYVQLTDLLDRQFPISKPGTASRAFHGRPDQDDWSDSSKAINTQVDYHHLYGIKSMADTVGTVVDKEVTICTTRCFRQRVFDIKPVTGDGTVPTFSARRVADSINLNAPGVSSATGRLKAFSCIASNGCDEKLYPVDHTGLMRNPNVLAEILSVLRFPTQLQGVAKSQIQTADHPSEPEIQSAYYLRVIGVIAATVQDSSGHSINPLNDSSENSIPSISSYTLAPNSFLLVATTNQIHIITFTTGANPIAVELAKGTDITTAQAVRYLDLNLPPSTTVRFQTTPEGIDVLQYDGDGDGTFESTVQPTASVSGNAAQDTQAPTIGVNEVPLAAMRRVTITATDDGAGVKSVFYSLDGTNFQPYNGAFEINPAATPIVYAFAEDNVANRSSLVTYNVIKRRKGRVFRRRSRGGF